MGTRQYIGARYVPLHRGEWDAQTQYEPLDVVMYTDGNSYTAKCTPPKGTVPTNEQYWALSAQFNQQLASINSAIERMEESISGIENKTGFVTPEFFGATGDGVNDDTEFVQKAINSGKPVFAFGKYKTTSALQISGNSKIIRIFGEIIYTGVNDAFIVKGYYHDIFIEKITSNGNGFTIRPTGNSETTGGCGISKFNINYIYASNHGIFIDCAYNNETKSCLLLHFNGRLIFSNRAGHPTGNGNCIHVETNSDNSSTSYINAVRFSNYQCMGGDSGLFARGTVSWSVYSLNIDNISFEGCKTNQMYLEGISGGLFNSINVNEGGKKIVAKKIYDQLTIIPTFWVKITQLDIDYASFGSSTSAIIFKGEIFNSGGTTICDKLIYTKSGAFTDSIGCSSINLMEEIPPVRTDDVNGIYFSVYNSVNDDVKTVTLPDYIFSSKGNGGGLQPRMCIITYYNASNVKIVDTSGRTVLTIPGVADQNCIVCKYDDISRRWVNSLH